MSQSSESINRKKYLDGKSIGDGVLRKEFNYSDHEDVIYHTLKQDSRDEILRENAAKRTSGIVGELGWGRMVATIPLVDLELLKRQHPELRDEAHPDFQKTLMSIITSPEGYQYRLQERI